MVIKVKPPPVDLKMCQQGEDSQDSQGDRGRRALQPWWGEQNRGVHMEEVLS